MTGHCIRECTPCQEDMADLSNEIVEKDARIAALEAALRGIERATLILVEKSRSDGVFGDGVRMALRPVLREIEQASAALAGEGQG